MDGPGVGTKRLNDDTSSSYRQQRQKRNKYTSVACNDCKKRKIKCSGGPVCQRCENLGLQCVFASTTTSASASSVADISTPEPLARLCNLETTFVKLQSQINQIYGLITSAQVQSEHGLETFAPEVIGLPVPELCVGRETTASYPSHGTRPHQIPQFVGLTSSAYGFGIGNSSLKSMGFQPDTEHSSKDPESTVNTPRSSPRLQPRDLPVLDPLERIGTDEALRLLTVYADELDQIYPFLDVSRMTKHVHLLQGARRIPRPFRQRLDDSAQTIDSLDTDILKMALAEAITIESLGQNALAEELVDTVDAARIKRSRAMQANINEVLLMAMISVYYFHCDEELLAWRTIGSAVRLALEMGLHRREPLFSRFPDPDKRSWAIKLFWCVYVLDRRWSFGVGMPFALQHTDIDPELPEPDDSSPYLQCLVAYGRISSEVWRAVNGASSASAKAQKQESAYLNFQVQQWQQAIPPELQLIHPRLDNGVDNGAQSQPRSLHRLRVLLHARANQMRILIYRHCLLSATSISKNLTDAQYVVNIAKDTIQILAHLNETSNIYHTQQVCFNYFLVSALAALFLAACHGPTYFSQSCRADFYLALDLIKGFSSKSLISRRLWKTIRDLQHVGPKLGLTPNAEHDVAVAMPTHSRTEADMTDATCQNQVWNPNSIGQLPEKGDWTTAFSVSDVGHHMTYALTDLFEAAGGNSDRLGGMHNGRSLIDQNGTHEGFSETQYSREDNEAVSRLWGDLISCDHPQYL